MRKFIFVLALLIATPAFALTVSCSQSGTNVAIQYSGADPCNPPRAFALSISIDSGMVIIDVNNYKANGESTSASRGYGIYPSGIDVNDEGDVNSWGGPLADPCDPGSGGGLGKDNIVAELGSLYYGDVNAPVVQGVTSGTLCNVVINPNSVSSATVTVTDEDTYRGGVVLEDGNTVSVNSNCPVSFVGPEEPNCFEGHPDQYVWRDWFEPNCWCDPYQCKGNADGDFEGSKKTGYFWVFTQDYNILAKAWKITEPNLPYHATHENPTYPRGITDCNYWIAETSTDVNCICADFDHDFEGSKKTGYFRVFTQDYNRLAKSWKVTEPNLPYHAGHEDPCFPDGLEPNCLYIY